MNRPRMRTFAWLVLLLFGAAPAGAEEIRKPIVVGIDEAYPPHQFRDAQGQPAGFDVDLFRAVADVDLPGMSGPDLARRVLGKWPGVRVFFTSAFPGVLDLPRGARYAFVTKPFTRESLAAALDEDAS